MKALSWVLNLAAVAVFIMALSVLGPMIESRFFPVYAKFKILDMQPTADGKASVLTIELRKLRDCIPQGYAWYSSDLGSFIQQLNVVSNTRNAAPVLPLGRHVSKFTIDGIKPADLPSLYAETFSRCHPLWVTRTVVFP